MLAGLLHKESATTKIRPTTRIFGSPRNCQYRVSDDYDDTFITHETQEASKKRAHPFNQRIIRGV